MDLGDVEPAEPSALGQELAALESTFKEPTHPIYPGIPRSDRVSTTWPTNTTHVVDSKVLLDDLVAE